MNIKFAVSQVRKNLVSSICATLAVLLLILFVIRKGGVSEIQSAVEAKTSESGTLKADILNSTSLREHLGKLKIANNLVSSRLMKLGDLAKSQQYFYKMETDSGVKLMDLRPLSNATSLTKNAAKSEYSAVSYSCTVQGTYQQLLVFLGKLESGDHFSRILSANVSLVGSGSEGAVMPDPALTMMISIDFLGQS